MSYSESLSQVRAAAKAADDRKGEDIVAFDVRGQSSITDSFLFISGTSHIHIRALEDAVREELKKNGAVLSRTDGQRGHLWRALDYGDFIIHIMDKKTREFYAMERLWEQAKRISLNLSVPEPVRVPVKRVKITVKKSVKKSVKKIVKKSVKKTTKKTAKRKVSRPRPTKKRKK